MAGVGRWSQRKLADVPRGTSRLGSSPPKECDSTAEGAWNRNRPGFGKAPGQGCGELTPGRRPGQQQAARLEQSALAEPASDVAQGPSRRGAEGLPADFLDAPLEDSRVRETDGPYDVPQKGALFPSWLDERHLEIRPGNGEGKPGESGSGADVNNPFAMSN